MFALHSAILFKGQYAFTDINVLPGVQDEFYLYSQRSLMTKDLEHWMMFVMGQNWLVYKANKMVKEPQHQRTTSQTALKHVRPCLDQNYSKTYHTDSIVQKDSGIIYGCRFLQKHPEKASVNWISSHFET